MQLNFFTLDYPTPVPGFCAYDCEISKNNADDNRTDTILSLSRMASSPLQSSQVSSLVLGSRRLLSKSLVTFQQSEIH